MNEETLNIEESQPTMVEEVPEQLTVEAPDGTEQEFAPVTEIIHEQVEEEEQPDPMYSDDEYTMLIEEMDPENPYGIEEGQSDATVMLGNVILAIGGIVAVAAIVYIISLFI